jgi:hypothetical protein
VGAVAPALRQPQSATVSPRLCWIGPDTTAVACTFTCVPSR